MDTLREARRLLQDAEAEARRALELYEVAGDSAGVERVRRGLDLVDRAKVAVDEALAQSALCECGHTKANHAQNPLGVFHCLRGCGCTEWRAARASGKG